MRTIALGLAAGALLLGAAALRADDKPKTDAKPQAPGKQTVSFSKEIVPIFKTECSKCHGAKQPQGGLSLISFAALDKGGRGGKEIAPKADDSRLVKYLEGKLQPKMPIGGSLKKEQIAKIRTWIDEGAKPDVDPSKVLIGEADVPVVKVPKIQVKVPVLPEAASMAWSKDGNLIAVGTYKVVLLIDPKNGKTVRTLTGHADKVHSLQFSPNGKLLAAAGGLPSQEGEVKIWDVTSGTCVKTLKGHADAIYSCAWAPDNKTLATGSYDKLIKLWNVETGEETKTLKDHADAVYGVAFNNDGSLLASGSADRSVKVWDVANAKRIYTLAGHTDIVFSVAFKPNGSEVASTGADKTVRTWRVNAQAGQQARNMTAHEKTVDQVVYSQDGSLLASVSEDHSAKIWNAGNGSQVQVIKDQPDGLMSAAISPDNKQIALGGFDGTVKIFNIADGKPVTTLIDLPKPAAQTASAAPAKPEAKDPKAVPAKATPKK